MRLLNLPIFVHYDHFGFLSNIPSHGNLGLLLLKLPIPGLGLFAKIPIWIHKTYWLGPMALLIQVHILMQYLCSQFLLLSIFLLLIICYLFISFLLLFPYLLGILLILLLLLHFAYCFLLIYTQNIILLIHLPIWSVFPLILWHPVFLLLSYFSVLIFFIV